MAKITLTIEGELAELRDILVRLSNEEDNSEAAIAEAEPSPDQWTFEEFARLWSLLSAGAQRILAEVARRPSGYPVSSLEAALGMNSLRIGGQLSSVGHRMREFPGKASIFMRDPALGGAYVLLSEVADAIRRLSASEA